MFANFYPYLGSSPNCNANKELYLVLISLNTNFPKIFHVLCGIDQNKKVFRKLNFSLLAMSQFKRYHVSGKEK